MFFALLVWPLLLVSGPSSFAEDKKQAIRQVSFEGALSRRGSIVKGRGLLAHASIHRRAFLQLSYCRAQFNRCSSPSPLLSVALHCILLSSPVEVDLAPVPGFVKRRFVLSLHIMGSVTKLSVCSVPTRFCPGFATQGRLGERGSCGP